MAGVNTVILVGNLGQDPEVREVGSDKVARVTLATTETYKDKSGNKVSDTEWHDIEFWGGLAGIVEQYLKKGTSIYVQGKIKTDNWVDKEGNKRKSVKIRAFNMTMLGGKQDQGDEGQDDVGF